MKAKEKSRGEEQGMNDERSAYALGSEEGEMLWFFGSLLTVKASAGQTDGQFMLVHQLAPGGMATPLHVQPEDNESFYILEGDLTFYLEDDRPMSASAGSFVHIPKGVAHAFQVDSETAQLLNFSTHQHEQFYRAAGESAQARELPSESAPDMEKVAAAAQEYGVEILGPPPGART